MQTPISDCLNDLKSKLEATVASVTVYDPDDMLDLTAHLQPPFTGLIYMGLVPNGADNTGRSSKMSFGVYTLGTKKNLRVKKGCSTGGDNPPTEGELVSVTTYLETIRAAIGGTSSPSFHPWQLTTERPYDFGDKGVGYLQVWQTTVNSI